MPPSVTLPRAGVRRPYKAIGALAIVALAAASFTGLRPASASAANLVVDPEFAHGATAWKVAGASMTVIAGFNGHKAIRITNTASAAHTLVLNDRINTVGSTSLKSTYAASVYVRSVTPGITADLRLGEWNASTSRQAPSQRSSYLRTSVWRKVAVSLTAGASGDSIDFNVLSWAVPVRSSFDVSLPSLVATTPTAPRPPATVAPTTPAPAPTTTARVTPAPTAPATTTTIGPSINSPGYRLVWHDEFAGTSVDTAKWNVRNNSCANNEHSTMTNRSTNVFVKDGSLNLRALRENYTGCGGTRSYTSGYVDSIGKESWQNARWEMRARLSKSQGSWPAFWLRANNTPGEIDIMEAVGGMTGFTAQTVHQSTNGDMDKRGHAFTVVGGVDSWHTYGLTKTATTMSWDIDGHTVFSVDGNSVPWLQSTFADAMNIRLNQQVGGSMPSYYHSDVNAASVFPSNYQIDYVRVFQN